LSPPFLSYQRGAHWAAPKLVTEVGFTTWTATICCATSFEGHREDKTAKDVKLERRRQAQRS
jgi:ATP-dependent DNA ligase